MSVDGIRRALEAARAGNGKVSKTDLDKVVIAARDGGKLDAAERAELLRQADSFDDTTKDHLNRLLVAAARPEAYTNIELGGAVTSIDDRYAQVTTQVPGLKAKLGLFDNTFSLEGKAKAAGTFEVTVDGKAVSVEVAKGDKPAAILGKLQAKLPANIASQVFDGSVRPHQIEDYVGAAADPGGKAAHITLFKPAELGLRPGEKPLRVVVTGYGAFMGITDNPSARIAQKISELGAAGAVIEYRRLDVTTEAVDAFIGEMRANPPDVILSMGVSSHAQVEERPENRLNGGADGAGHILRTGPIVPGGPAELPTDLPLDVINPALDTYGPDRRVGSSASDATYQPDRSAYLCNYLGYSLAGAFGDFDGTAAGFVHVTATTPPEQMSTLLRAVVSRRLELRRQGPGTPPSS